ncbi:hypothetical protein [Tetragenococcus halophilus]|uniref:hypothetical protein n=1 Tax=Tetragenococcus halophilus TaxID=51669 RepID=UPI00300FA5FE
MKNDFIIKMLDGTTLFFTGENGDYAFTAVENALERGAVTTIPMQDAEGFSLTLVTDKILFYGEQIKE